MKFFFGGGGSEGNQQPQKPRIPTPIAGTGSGTSRVSRPETPDQAGVATPDDFYDRWFTRMGRYARVTSAVSTGGPRTLGTQARRN